MAECNRTASGQAACASDSEISTSTRSNGAVSTAAGSADVAAWSPLPAKFQPYNATRSEAAVMAGILADEYGVPVRWQETRSRDTADNAAMSAEILKAAGIRRIVLVTQAFHMPRAAALFRAAGLEVVPAPTQFKAGGALLASPTDFLPSAYALRNTYYALHEWLGLAWRQLVARVPDLR